ncbi:hypothetical protein GCM10028785_09450 [Hydrogenophaga soli]
MRNAFKRILRCSAIEPIIGHLKADHRMDCYHVKGETGDRLHAVLCAAGHNIQWLLRINPRMGLASLPMLTLRVCEMVGCQRTSQERWALCLSTHSLALFRVLSACTFE